MNNQSYTRKASLAFAKAVILKGSIVFSVFLFQTNMSNAQDMAFVGNATISKTEVKSSAHTEPVVKLKTLFIKKVKKEIEAGSGPANAIEIVYSSFFSSNIDKDKFDELVRIKAEVLKEMVKCDEDGVN